MKIHLLSHRFGNIGHNFMAVGIEKILEKSISKKVDFVHIEQHRPFDIYARFSAKRLLNKAIYRNIKYTNQILDDHEALSKYWPEADLKGVPLAIACGGPNLTKYNKEGRGLNLMLGHLNGAYHYHGTPLMDFGVGSSYPLQNAPHSLDEPDALFYKKVSMYPAEITVRDELAKSLFGGIGIDTTLIPCAALCSGFKFEEDRQQNPKYFLINFMEAGANTDWGQKINRGKWLKTMLEFRSVLKSKGQKVMMMCHNQKEKMIAEKYFTPDMCVFPKTEAEYSEAISHVSAGIACRLHCAIALAGVGKPSLVVGTDTRLGTADLIGLETVFVEDLTKDTLTNFYNLSNDTIEVEHDRLLSVRNETLKKYKDIIHKYIW